jgi:hypothetical protein
MAANGRGFWMHQLVEYGIAGGLIMMSAQSATPLAPASMGLAILFNVAVADGPMSAFKWFSRRVHKYIDWAIIVCALAASAILDLDVQARLVLLAVGLVMAIIVLGTNFVKKGAQQPRGK